MRAGARWQARVRAGARRWACVRAGCRVRYVPDLQKRGVPKGVAEKVVDVMKTIDWFPCANEKCKGNKSVVAPKAEAKHFTCSAACTAVVEAAGALS